MSLSSLRCNGCYAPYTPSAGEVGSIDLEYGGPIFCAECVADVIASPLPPLLEPSPRPLFNGLFNDSVHEMEWLQELRNLGGNPSFLPALPVQTDFVESLTGSLSSEVSPARSSHEERVVVNSGPIAKKRPIAEMLVATGETRKKGITLPRITDLAFAALYVGKFVHIVSDQHRKSFYKYRILQGPLIKNHQVLVCIEKVIKTKKPKTKQLGRKWVSLLSLRPILWQNQSVLFGLPGDVFRKGTVTEEGYRGNCFVQPDDKSLGVVRMTAQQRCLICRVIPLQNGQDLSQFPHDPSTGTYSLE